MALASSVKNDERRLGFLAEQTYATNNGVMRLLPPWSFKQWTALLVFGAAVFVLLLVGLVFLAFRLAEDEPLLDDSDLRIQPPEGVVYESPENGYQRLLALQDALETEEGVPKLYELMEVKAGKPDWAAVRQRLAEKQEVLDQVDHILASPYYTIKWPPWAGSEYPGISAALRFAQLMNAQGRMAMQDGDEERAWQDVQKLFALRNGILNGDGELVHFMVGFSIQALGQGMINDHASVFAPDSATTLLRTTWLEQFLLTKEEMLRFFHYKYMSVIGTLDFFENELMEEKGSDSPYTRFIYKPHETRNAVATYFREAIGNVGLPIGQMKIRDDEETFDSYTRWSYSLSGNSIGVTMMALGFPHFRVAKTYVEMNATLQLTRLGLALAGYANQHDGTLPEKLEFLAPLYIDKIPLDPVTGEAFIYDREKRKIWSVGRNLKDDGGIPRDDKDIDDPYDLVVEIPEIPASSPTTKESLAEPSL